jgi:NAD(P)-dependent dehydrogenase (short-subunit alcohol dehydrogenase family)
MKTILITGASSGIGLSTALLFANRGWRVAATGRNLEKLSAAFAGVENVSLYPLDVTSPASISECVARVIADCGGIDVLVNNAGVYTTEPLETSSDEIIDSVVRTNIEGVLLVTRAVLPHFRERRAGTIVNISSIAGRISIPFQTVYHTSKWAVEGLSEGLRYELAPLGIRVRVVEPGVVKTPLYRSMGETPEGEVPEEYRHGFRNWWAFIRRSYRGGYPPEREAATVWRAVNSHCGKLRFRTDLTTRAAVMMHTLLPLRFFQWIVAKVSGV